MGRYLLGQTVGQLRLPFAGSHTDGDRQPQITADAGAQPAGPVLQIAVAGTAQPCEGLID